jgi:hypothetical protein
MRVLCSIVMTLAALGGPLPAAEADYLEPQLLAGSIYEKAGGRLLFTFRRTATQTGDVVSVLREFHNPDGSVASRERVRYERGRLARFELDERQTGAAGHAVVEVLPNQRQRVQFEYTTGSGRADKRRPKSETIREQPLISDMLPGFIAEHWEELRRGESVNFRYLVVPRLETIAFKLRRDTSAELHGKKVVRVKMEAANALIAQFVDPLVFTVEAEPPHRIVQYWGRTTPKVRSGGSWKDLDALTVFDWDDGRK